MSALFPIGHQVRKNECPTLFSPLVYTPLLPPIYPEDETYTYSVTLIHCFSNSLRVGRLENLGSMHSFKSEQILIF